MWYTNTFVNTLKPWVCPNVTDIELLNYYNSFEMNVYTCSRSVTLDEEEGAMSSYVQNDHSCVDRNPDNFNVAMMLLSHTFNPYSFYEDGMIQTSTRFDGEYFIDTLGNYQA